MPVEVSTPNAPARRQWPEGVVARIGPRKPPIASQCWVCGSGRTYRFKKRSIDRPLVPEDLRITDSHYGATLALLRCADCGFIFSDQTDVGELVALYERLEDPAYEETQDARALQMRWLLRRAKRVHAAARSVLDVGAGAGLLVAEARQAGYEAVGVEPSRALVEAARRVHGVELLQGTYPHPALEGKRFDLIFLVDVIEHVAKPVELIRACRGGLAPGGMLLVVTPDIGSLTARILRRRWWHLRLAHVGYFDRRSIDRAAQQSGLELVDRCRPTWFFRAKYVAERLVRYLPIGWLNRFVSRVRPLDKLYDTVIPVNPRDSMMVTMRRAA